MDISTSINMNQSSINWYWSPIYYSCFKFIYWFKKTFVCFQFTKIKRKGRRFVRKIRKVYHGIKRKIFPKRKKNKKKKKTLLAKDKDLYSDSSQINLDKNNNSWFSKPKEKVKWYKWKKQKKALRKKKALQQWVNFNHCYLFPNLVFFFHLFFHLFLLLIFGLIKFAYLQ